MKTNSQSLAAITMIAGIFHLTPASAAVFDFHFTGQYTLVDATGGYMDQTPISSTLTYDDISGTGFSGDMTIADFDTFGSTATIYDITLERVSGTNFILGNMLADWNINYGMPVSMVWDATGLFNAINIGLQAGDVISGTNLKRGGNIIADVGSATPASDGIPYSKYDPLNDSYDFGNLNQGPHRLRLQH